MQSPDPKLLFGEAIQDLAAEPTLVNAQRYLAASRLLALGAERPPAEAKQG